MKRDGTVFWGGMPTTNGAWSDCPTNNKASYVLRLPYWYKVCSGEWRISFYWHQPSGLYPLHRWWKNERSFGESKALALRQNFKKEGILQDERETLNKNRSAKAIEGINEKILLGIRAELLVAMSRVEGNMKAGTRKTGKAGTGATNGPYVNVIDELYASPLGVMHSLRCVWKLWRVSPHRSFRNWIWNSGFLDVVAPSSCPAKNPPCLVEVSIISKLFGQKLGLHIVFGGLKVEHRFMFCDQPHSLLYGQILKNWKQFLHNVTRPGQW